MKSNKTIQSFLRQSVKKIIAKFPTVEKIILFGSYAYGKPGRDSDVDLLIVMRTNKRWPERMRDIDSLFPERTIPMDFVVRTPAEIKKRLTSYFCPFTREVIQNGRVLYETPTRRSRLASKSRG